MPAIIAKWIYMLILLIRDRAQRKEPQNLKTTKAAPAG